MLRRPTSSDTFAVRAPERQEGAPGSPLPEGPTLDAHRLRALELDLLGRPPLPDERRSWTGRGVRDLLAELLGSRAFWEDWLEEQLYYFMLVDNFRPADDGVRSIPDALESGAIGIREALRRILLCASFDRRNPGPDTFVTVVMEQVLGKNVQREARMLEIGKRMYDGAPGTFYGKKGNSQADVVRIAIEDDLALSHFLEREHQRLLRTPPDSHDLAAWTRRLVEDEHRYPEILGDWLESSAYERRLEQRVPMPNRVYVRSLFVDIFGRLPEESETQRMRSALDGLADAAPLRSVIARLLIDSGKASVPAREKIPDPRAWIASSFEGLLGRAASPTELAAFAQAFAEPACRPETVVYALVSHPSYATW